MHLISSDRIFRTKIHCSVCKSVTLNTCWQRIFDQFPTVWLLNEVAIHEKATLAHLKWHNVVAFFKSFYKSVLNVLYPSIKASNEKHFNEIIIKMDWSSIDRNNCGNFSIQSLFYGHAEKKKITLWVIGWHISIKIRAWNALRAKILINFHP